MKKLFISALLMVAAAGCKSNPYCLNCKDSGNGVITPEDMTPVLVDGGDDGMTTLPDMTGQGGPCAPTNGGIEICDGLDNDCNGKIDDVDPSRLIGDPKNCGACGTECKFPHAFGQCVGGFDGGTPMCKENGCQPGYIDLDGDPTNGCEYVCTPTTPSTEVCDGKDNNCDGQVDEGFTTTWFDPAKQMPKYDKLLADCGECGTVCSLGPGTNMACQGTGANGRGQCAVVSCVNGPDGNGVHQTYRHNPTAGPITTTGCEYHCPKAATTIGNDCNPNGACTFPAETCNGIDDDCDFVADDNVTDPGINGACPDGAPGKLCQDATTCGKGVCKAGTLKCIGGGLVCQGSVGPSPEVCNTPTPLDDDCNGKVDDPFTATWQDAGNQIPRYDSDPNNCGACSPGHVCALPNGANICRLAGGDTKGSCAILACNPGYAYVPKTDSNPANPMCDKVTAGQRDSTQSTPGIGCFYKCGQANNTPEVCDAVDNDCNGCIDDGLTPPPICSTKGVCATSGNTVSCKGGAGWKCVYGPGVDVDGMGNLATTEVECDNLDNNCNGSCDENFPDVPVSGATCNNPHSAKACAAGQGACLVNGTFACNMAKTAEVCQNGGTVVGVNGDLTKATDELCNGKDDDCNGLVDEASDYTVSGTTYHGWHDPVAQVAVGVDPYTGQAAHTVYVYSYEASRPDATAVSPGSLSARACSNYGVLPWSNVTLEQAQAACAGIKNAASPPVSIGRVCSAWEWQQTCDGNATPATHWSMSASTTAYVSQVCNDAAETEQRCNPTAKNCTKTCNAQNQCTCTGDADCGGAVGSCASGVCTGSVCPLQCAKTCNANGQCTCTGNADCSPGFTCNASNICVGGGAWPTGSIGTAGAANQCYVDYAANGRAHDLSGNLQEWTATSVTLKSGTAASIAMGPGSQWTVNGLTGIFSTDVGAQLILSGATNAGNNGTFDIVAVNSATSVVINNPTGATQAGATITWKFIYEKLRGGNFATTSSGGDVCEFDFDIQKASFVNNNVGFRCCSDVAP